MHGEQTRRRERREERAAAGDPTADELFLADPPEEGDSLLEQARAWGEVARDAWQECEFGGQADRELARRRNRSGQ